MSEPKGVAKLFASIDNDYQAVSKTITSAVGASAFYWAWYRANQNESLAAGVVSGATAAATAKMFSYIGTQDPSKRIIRENSMNLCGVGPWYPESVLAACISALILSFVRSQPSGSKLPFILMVSAAHGIGAGYDLNDSVAAFREMTSKSN